eukprot:GGOE01050080.1.p3 GENE.GGOE01050080.1~~GGOE01050080.1.p3  ORF type:complete len:205 (-),score=5.80 GGOE01050080.1:87-701(-)
MNAVTGTAATKTESAGMTIGAVEVMAGTLIDEEMIVGTTGGATEEEAGSAGQIAENVIVIVIAETGTGIGTATVNVTAIASVTVTVTVSVTAIVTVSATVIRIVIAIGIVIVIGNGTGSVLETEIVMTVIGIGGTIELEMAGDRVEIHHMTEVDATTLAVGLSALHQSIALIVQVVAAPQPLAPPPSPGSHRPLLGHHLHWEIP